MAPSTPIPARANGVSILGFLATKNTTASFPDMILIQPRSPYRYSAADKFVKHFWEPCNFDADADADADANLAAPGCV